MHLKKSNAGRSLPPNTLLGVFNRDLAAATASCLILTAASSSQAGYAVEGKIEQNRFTWIVHNLDQNWGLDQFAVDVPAEMNIVAYSVPPPFANPEGNAYWIMAESRDAQVDPHDGRAWLPAAKSGRKWIVWSGLQSPSVYPPGSTAIFSITTDKAVKTGAITATATTYTPQANPRYYLPFQVEIVGPVAVEPNVVTSKSVGDKANMTVIPQAADDANSYSDANDAKAVGSVNLTVGMFPGLTIEGVVGRTYEIQYATNLLEVDGWRHLANVVLASPKQIWIDPQPSSAGRFYRVVSGPVPTP